MMGEEGNAERFSARTQEESQTAFITQSGRSLVDLEHCSTSTRSNLCQLAVDISARRWGESRGLQVVPVHQREDPVSHHIVPVVPIHGTHILVTDTTETFSSKDRDEPMNSKVPTAAKSVAFTSGVTRTAFGDRFANCNRGERACSSAKAERRPSLTRSECRICI